MTEKPDTHIALDEDARELAGQLMSLRHAALSYLDVETAQPGISRIAFGQTGDGGFMTLISALAPHSAGLAAHPQCAVLLGEPGAKGDPLTHPRLMIRARAEFVLPGAADRPRLRDHWLVQNPKSKLYIDFADFALVRLLPLGGVLNGGFARACTLTASDVTDIIKGGLSGHPANHPD